MRFFVYRVDKPGTAALRAETRPAHLDYAATLGEALVFAGPTLADDGETMDASVWVIEAASREDAERITAEDPYEKADLFETKLIKPFLQVVPEVR
jgi:uncharacterized protein YciI